MGQRRLIQHLHVSYTYKCSQNVGALLCLSALQALLLTQGEGL